MNERFRGAGAGRTRQGRATDDPGGKSGDERKSDRRGTGANALETAVRLLASRALTAEEVRLRLARRGFPKDAADAAVADLTARGYLDDRAVAYNMVASRAKRLLGRPRIAAELRRRGIAEPIVEEALRQTFAELDENDLVRRAAAKLLPGGRAPRDEREKGRMVRALARRGFSTGAIVRAVRSATGAPDDAPESAPEDVERAFDED
jgi:regulatory protein